MKLSNLQSYYPYILTCLFFGILLYPLRTLAFDPYAIEESFYGRARLISWTSSLRLAFGDRVFPRVIAGDDGWLVFTAEEDIETYQRVRPFTEVELAQFQQNLDALSARYAARGITLLIIVPPNKNTIYPERVPAEVPIAPNESQLNQILNYLQAHGKQQIIDLRPALLAAKTERQMYYATDTHWNEYGSYLAYRALLDELSQTHSEISPHAISDYKQVTTEPDLLDLARVIGATELLEARIQLRPQFDLRTSYKSINLGQRKLMFSYNPDSTLPDLVLYYDSFFFNVIPMLGEHFQRGTYIQNYSGGGLWNLSWVEERTPDVVIIEMAERYLSDLPVFIDPNR